MILPTYGYGASDRKNTEKLKKYSLDWKRVEKHINSEYAFLQNMIKRKEDIYVAVLKFDKDNIGKPFKFPELEKHLKDKGYEYEEFALRQFFAALFISVESPGGNNQHSPIDPNQTFFLEQTGYFHLLKFEELESARKSSLQATCFAGIAIFISVASTCISIYYSNKQLNNPKVTGSSPVPVTGIN